MFVYARFLVAGMVALLYVCVLFSHIMGLYRQLVLFRVVL